jgi:NHL repeat
MWTAFQFALVITLVVPACTAASTFDLVPILPDDGIERLDRSVARASFDRDLISAPRATVVIGDVDLYDEFPFVETRYFQVISDGDWNRLLYGALGKGVRAFDGQGSVFGALASPRGLAADERGRIYVADSENGRVLVFETRREFDEIDLVPLFEVRELSRPIDVAYSDGGTPFSEGDDRLYVVDAGRNAVAAYAIEASGGARLAASIGGLGGGVGRFAGPTAIAIGRADGVATADLFVADAHNRRIVQLRDAGDRFEWIGESPFEGDRVASLETDSWGNLYATDASAGCVSKISPGLEVVAELRDELAQPRDFHIPVVNVHDHRAGKNAAAVERSLQPSALVVEAWSDASGIRLVKLGMELAELELSSGDAIRASFLLTDAARVTCELRDARVPEPLETVDAGVLPAGRHALTLTTKLSDLGAALPFCRVEIVARSLYEGGEVARKTAALAPSPDAFGAASAMEISPNPFSNLTRVACALPSGSTDPVRVGVFTIEGRRVREIVSDRVVSGRAEIVWDGRDEKGDRAPAGVYLFRWAAGDREVVRKGVLLR